MYYEFDCSKTTNNIKVQVLGHNCDFLYIESRSIDAALMRARQLGVFDNYPQPKTAWDAVNSDNYWKLYQREISDKLLHHYSVSIVSNSDNLIELWKDKYAGYDIIEEPSVTFNPQTQLSTVTGIIDLKDIYGLMALMRKEKNLEAQATQLLFTKDCTLYNQNHEVVKF